MTTHTIDVRIDEKHEHVLVTIGEHALSYDPLIALEISADIIDSAHLPGQDLALQFADLPKVPVTDGEAIAIGMAIAVAADQLLDEADYKF